MAYIIADRVKETTTSTGTGVIVLAGAVAKYVSFSSAMSIGDTCPYAIVSRTAQEWEVGIATYSAANTLTRTTVHSSTNAGAAVNFSAGTKDVFLSATAETLVSNVTSNDNTVTLAKTGSVVDLSVAVAAATTNVIVQVRNTTGATLAKGTAVYLNGTVGQIPTVAKALATSDATSAQTLGLISADLANNSNGYVTIIGLISDINTSAFTDGQQLYLSGTIAGGLTATKPYAPTHLVYVAVVEHAHVTQGKLFVKVQNGYELDELHDVAVQSPSNGQTIVYNSSNSLWEKNTVSLTNGVNGILPVANGGTGVTTSTGTGSVVLSNAPTLTTATLAAGTITTSTPNTITQTWNNAATVFTALSVTATNTANDTKSLIADFKVGSTSSVSLSAKGGIVLGNVADWTASAELGGAGIANCGGSLVFSVGSTRLGAFGSYAGGAFGQGFSVTLGAYIGFNSNTAISGANVVPDTTIYRDAADTIAQRRTTNAQTFRVYNTYTDASNYERFSIGWASNVCTIGVEKGGTGTNRTMRVDLGGNPSSGANYIEALATNNVRIVAGNVLMINIAGQSSITLFNYYYSGGTLPIYLGQSNAGVTNRLGDNFVFRNQGGSGNGTPGTIGFGTAYPVASGTTGHTAQDVFLCKLPADSAGIYAFGQGFTATVPALIRSGTTLKARLADDSGDATIQALLSSNSISAVPVTSGAGNNLTITAGSGVTSGAGGNLILQAGLQTTTGGDGKVVVKKRSGQTSNLQEWQNESGTTLASVNSSGVISGDGSGLTNLGPQKISPLTYTYTGTLTIPPIILLSTPTPYQDGSSVLNYSGKWANTLTLSIVNTSLTSITFSDLQGITGGFQFSSLSSLTSMSFPVLTTVNSIFSISTMAALTTLNIPVLTTVIGNFTPNSASALTILDMPSLKMIGGSFQPSSMAALTTLNIPSLTTVGGSFSPTVMGALTSLSCPALTAIGNAVNITSMTALTLFDFPVLTIVNGNFNISSTPAVTSLNCPALTTVNGAFNPNNMPVLTSLNCSALTSVSGNVNLNSMAALTSLNFTALATVVGSFNPSTMGALTTLNIPSLTTVGGSFNPSTMGVLTTLSIPVLTTVGGIFGPTTMASLTSISIPSIVSLGTSITSGSVISLSTGTAALTNFQLPSTLLQVGSGAGNVVITSAALNQTSVDSILVRLAALDGTAGTTLFSNRTVTITGTSSTPSATGLAAKATLVARGCTVTNN